MGEELEMRKAYILMEINRNNLAVDLRIDALDRRLKQLEEL